MRNLVTPLAIEKPCVPFPHTAGLMNEIFFTPLSASVTPAAALMKMCGSLKSTPSMTPPAEVWSSMPSFADDENQQSSNLHRDTAPAPVTLIRRGRVHV